MLISSTFFEVDLAFGLDIDDVLGLGRAELKTRMSEDFERR